MVTSKDGTLLAVDQTGEGQAVVCVGGALNDRRSTGWVATNLTAFTTYSYDRRGRGDSGDTQPYAVEREIEDLAAVLEEAGGSAMVYGMSSGAVLALRAAAAGLPITRLALYEPPLRGAVTSAPPEPPNYAARLETAIAAGHPAEALNLFMTEAVGLPPEVVAGLRQTPTWPALEALAPTLRYDNAVMADSTIPPVSHVTIPVTVLAGGASPAWLRQAAQALAAALPNSTVRELPNQTHDVDPKVLAAALSEAFS